MLVRPALPAAPAGPEPPLSARPASSDSTPSSSTECCGSRRDGSAARPGPAGSGIRGGRDAAAGRRVVHHGGQHRGPARASRPADGDPASGDMAVDEAFDSSGQVLDLFASQFARQSVDGKGARCRSRSTTAELRQRVLGRTQLVFGDGDGVIFDRFTKPMDVMAHEFTHGVTQFTAGLTYVGQSGALNESISDVFAAMTKQRALGAERRRGGLADRRGHVPAGVNARALQVDARARHRVRRPADRQGSTGRTDGRLRRRPPRTTAACTSIPASPTARSPCRVGPRRLQLGRIGQDLVRRADRR